MSSAKALTGPQLTAALLTPSDVGAGYFLEPVDPSFKRTYYCGYTPPTTPSAEALRTFASGSGATEKRAAVYLDQYATATAASKAFDALGAALKTCQSEESDGHHYAYTVVPSPPKLGSNSIGVKETAAGAESRYYYVLDGPVIVEVGLLANKDLDDGEARAALTKQVQRYEAMNAVPSPTASGPSDPAQADLEAQIAAAKPIAEHDLALVLKDPDAHKGEIFKIWGSVTQFDAATGATAFRADVAATNTSSSGYFKGTNAVFMGSAAMLKDLVNKDLFVATVRVSGSLVYSTQIGGQATVGEFEVLALQRE